MLDTLLDASPSAGGKTVGVVVERAQGGVLRLVKVCCDVSLLGAANVGGIWVNKATTTHPRLPHFGAGKKRGGCLARQRVNECTKARQEAKVWALWHGKAKKGRQSQTKERKQANAGHSIHTLLVPLAHTREGAWRLFFCACGTLQPFVLAITEGWFLLSRHHDHTCEVRGNKNMLYVKGLVVSIAVAWGGLAHRHVVQGHRLHRTEKAAVKLNMGPAT